MVRFDQYPSEEHAVKAIIEEALNGHEERLMTLFIQHGPQELRKMLGIPSDFVWSMVFDRLVFDFDVLKRCVDMFFPFFKDYVLKNGPNALRGIFGIEDARYDSVFEKLVDDMVIARGLLFEHLYQHTSSYLSALKQGRGDDIRAQLGIASSKYDPLWNEVVDFFLDAFSREKLKEKQVEDTKSFLSLLQSLLSK